jgi:four helix bundle protein
MAKGDDIQERLIGLAVSIARLCDSLSRSVPSTHISNQLIRCGTAPAAHYGEARSGESKKDFIHKLGIALKELNECLVWLQLLKRLGFVEEKSIDSILTECTELCRILSASIKTASGKQNKNS